jgi:hypothetical protein
MTLRGIDGRIAGALKERAQKEDTSVNTVMLRILKESLGLEKKKRRVLYDDLDHLAATYGVIRMQPSLSWLPLCSKQWIQICGNDGVIREGTSNH